jgi:site-specific DNA-adenine methylase
MIYASRGILNNLLNQMQLFKLEALKSNDFDRDVINLYDNAIKEASELIDTLTRVEALSKENITIAENAKKHIDSNY